MTAVLRWLLLSEHSCLFLAMKLKLCITFILILIAAICLSATILLIPIVVWPSLTRDAIEYDPAPVVCSLHQIQVIKSRKKCRASHSCRQDCDVVPTRCVRLFVDYRERLRNESVTYSSLVHWSALHVPLWVNPRRCGDSEGLDCATFESLYKINEEFPCHRSLGEPLHTVLELSFDDDQSYPLIVSLGLPFSLVSICFGICGILSFWYCRGSPGYHKEEDLDIETERKYAFE